MEEIYKLFVEQKDDSYALFQSKLIPQLPSEKFIGVRTPVLRKLAKALSKKEETRLFLRELPHTYFDEDQLHGFLISEMKDFTECIGELELFLPYIDNWATCDQTSPKVFRMHTEELLPYIRKWLQSERVYTVRFAIGMLMQFYLEEHFKPEYIEMVASVTSDQYYINMEIAWYMATALAKQWEVTIPYIEGKKMNQWVHNKTIQKCRESFRITKEQKTYLQQFKMK